MPTRWKSALQLISVVCQRVFLQQVDRSFVCRHVQRRSAIGVVEDHHLFLAGYVQR